MAIKYLHMHSSGMQHCSFTGSRGKNAILLKLEGCIQRWRQQAFKNLLNFIVLELTCFFYLETTRTTSFLNLDLVLDLDFGVIIAETYNAAVAPF